jgi:tetratricopeptide (TPR) repeat protein
MMRVRVLWRCVSGLGLVCVLAPCGSAYAQLFGECGSLRNHFGPFDYRTAPKNQLELVEDYHFTPSVENLTKGASGLVGQDLTYTLRVFPNHHRALASISKLAQREKNRKPRGSQFTVDCWFERALQFAPNDAHVYLLYGIDLARVGKHRNAVAVLEKSLELTADNVNTQYNLGLAYFEIGEYEKSLAFAKQAYAGGFPLLGLKNKLQKAGKWRD